MQQDIGHTLRLWRKSRAMKQSALAQLLGVSQGAISHWENGTDLPSPAMLARIRELVGREFRGQLEVESRIVEAQVGIRALFGLDGVRLLATSPGFKTIWPEMLALEGVPLADQLVDVTRDIHTDAELMRAVRQGDVAMISGVSERHVDRVDGVAFKHHWTALYRRIGTLHSVELSFEPAAPDQAVGLGQVLRLDELAL